MKDLISGQYNEQFHVVIALNLPDLGLIIFLIESFYSIIYDLGELNNEDYCQKQKNKNHLLYSPSFISHTCMN